MKRKIISAVLFVLCAALLAASISGYIIRGTESTSENLNEMRTYAVLNVASNGLIEKIVSTATADKLKEIRKDPDFRSWGQAEVQRRTEEAGEIARAEAQEKYGNIYGADTAALDVKVRALELALTEHNAAEDSAKAEYAVVYNSLIDGVSSWTELVGENTDDEIWAELCGEFELNAAYKDSFVKLAHDMAEAEAVAAAAAESSNDETVDETVDETAEEDTVDYSYFVATHSSVSLSVSNASESRSSCRAGIASVPL